MINVSLTPMLEALKTNAKQWRHEKLLNWRYGLVEKHIARGYRVLDQGAGTGWVGWRLHQRKGCRVRLVDVLDRNETELAHEVYDGRRLPYADGSFDVTLLIFVLHHARNQEEILSEAARVSSVKIVVVEDTPRNRFERAVNTCCDTFGNLKPGFLNPHNYRKIDEWRRIFAAMGLDVIHQEVVRPFFPYIYAKTVFVLSP